MSLKNIHNKMNDKPRWPGPVRRLLTRWNLTGMIFLVLLLPWAVADTVFEERWKNILSVVRETFPEVQQISTQQLANMLANNEEVLLLDARSEEEFNTSHLQGALHSDTVNTALSAINTNDQQQTIVVYCSVGYRSSDIAKQLQARGVKNVVNLEGSLFQWANEGRPIVQGTKPVTHVHPYDDDWGQLLHEPLRSE